MSCARTRTSVGPPRWTWRSTCSTACWTWDARPTPASPDPKRGWGQCAHSPDPCSICGRPLPGKGKLQDCRGAWSDAAICPASGAAANRRGPVWEMLWGERRGAGIIVARQNRRSAPMPQLNDQSRSPTVLKPDSTLIAVLEMSQSAWLVAGLVPGIERPPLKKIEPDEAALLRLLRRWQEEATQAGHPITRITLAFEAGRDGFWLARWLRAHGIEAHVIHPTSVAVSREHRRAKTDRLDTALLKRAFLGWLRGERGHCSMAEIPTLQEEDAKRPTREREGLVRERPRLVNRIKGALARLGIRGFKPTLRHAPERLSALRLPEGAPLPPNTLAELRRDMARLRFVLDQIREIEAARLNQLEQHPEKGTHTMVRLLARILGIGIETADMLVHEV